MAAAIWPFDLSLENAKTKAIIFMSCTWGFFTRDGSYQHRGVCGCVSVHVFVLGNLEAHLPQQIFPGDGGGVSAP